MRLVAISDAHLGRCGEPSPGRDRCRSLLARAIAAPDPVCLSLARHIDDFAAGEALTLVACGDLLDLANAPFDRAWDDLRQLLEVLRPVDHLVIVPGNHDHHALSLHDDERNLLSPLREGRSPESRADREARAPEPFSPCPRLQLASGRVVGITIASPTFALDLPDRRVRFTHGHLATGLPALLADLVQGKGEGVAAHVADPLIELLYWLLPRAGASLDQGGLLSLLRDDLARGHDGRIARALKNTLSGRVGSGIAASIEQAALVRGLLFGLRWLVDQDDGGDTRSRDRHATVSRTREAISRLANTIGLVASGRVDRIDLVYGHTHVPDRHTIAPGVEGFNLGSWLEEPGHPAAPRVYALDASGPGSRVDFATI